MATITASAAVAPNQPRVPRGPEVVARCFDFLKTTTLSAGDVVLLTGATIPHGAQLIQARLSGQTKDGTIIITPFLRVGAADTTMGSLTLSVAGRIGDLIHTSAADSAHLPFTVSVSDDAAVRYAQVGFTVGTTVSHTGSTSLSIILSYIQDR